MTTARLTRTVQFSAAHRYHRPDWSDEQNQSAFGACWNEPGHGHNYRCAVTVRGSINNDRSMVLNLTDFDAILAEHVVDRFDHQHINLTIPEFAYGREIPTAEALAVYIWNSLAPHLAANVELQCVRVEEDATLHAEYHGE